MDLKSEVSIRFAKTGDLESIRLFLRKYFFKDEPLAMSLQIVTDENPSNEDYEKYCLQAFGKGLDFVAECEGDLVGVCLNALLDKGVPKPEILFTPGNNAEIIFRIMEDAEEKVDYFSRYADVERIMFLFILSVHPDFRRRGIAKEFLSKTKELGKKNNAGLMAIECSNLYSAAASKSIGLEKIYSMDYAEYKLNGEVVINPAPPHKTLAVYAARI